MGVDKMQYFGHRSPGAISYMFLQTGSVVQEVKKSGLYGLLIDEVTDISATEQLITFLRFCNSITAVLIISA